LKTTVLVALFIQLKSSYFSQADTMNIGSFTTKLFLQPHKISDIYTLLYIYLFRNY